MLQIINKYSNYELCTYTIKKLSLLPKKKKKMIELNRDILYLILKKELQDDKKVLYSCLLVGKTRCEIFHFYGKIFGNIWEKGTKNYYQI